MHSELNLEQVAKAGCEITDSRPKHEVEQVVTMARLELYNRGESCGPKAVRNRLDDYAVRPLPSTRTIARILKRQGLSNARTGFYDDEPRRPLVTAARQAGAPNRIGRALTCPDTSIGPIYWGGKERGKQGSLIVADPKV